MLPVQHRFFDSSFASRIFVSLIFWCGIGCCWKFLFLPVMVLVGMMLFLGFPAWCRAGVRFCHFAWLVVSIKIRSDQFFCRCYPLVTQADGCRFQDDRCSLFWFFILCNPGTAAPGSIPSGQYLNRVTSPGRLARLPGVAGLEVLLFWLLPATGLTF